MYSILENEHAIVYSIRENKHVIHLRWSVFNTEISIWCSLFNEKKVIEWKQTCAGVFSVRENKHVVECFQFEKINM